LDCRKCSDTKKEALGCKKETENSPYSIDGEILKRCPLKLITRQSTQYLRFFHYYEKGYLPNEGTITNQPGKFLDAMMAIENIISEMKQEHEKKLRNKK